MKCIPKEVIIEDISVQCETINYLIDTSKDQGLSNILASVLSNLEDIKDRLKVVG